MLAFIYGTTGELIKIAPLLKAIPREQYLLINTMQQARQLPKLQKQLGITDDFRLANGHRGSDLENYFQVLAWLPKVMANFIKNRKKIKLALKKRGTSRPLVIIHGDTNTTVLGALIGKITGIEVAHVEAGLRSFDLLHPFPEELNRRVVTKLARLHFAPGEQPVANLHKAKGKIINTVFNTVKDSIGLVSKIDTIVVPANLPAKYGIVSIHRNELLSQKKAFKDLLMALSSHDLGGKNLIFLDHPVTAEKIRSLKYEAYLQAKNITRVPKLDYPSFMKLLSGAEFVITDSGGLQEECTYLNIACVVHRKVTERQEGLGANVELTGMRATAVSQILDKLLERKSTHGKEESVSPSRIIVDYLAKEKYINFPR